MYVVTLGKKYLETHKRKHLEIKKIKMTRQKKKTDDIQQMIRKGL